MDRRYLKNIKEINVAKKISSLRKECDVDGFFIDEEIYRAS